ncbi:MAG: ABC transporter ATP-binding protein/permease, partial [Achromobacter ruhlandii]
MNRTKIDLRGQAFKDVLGFTFRYWRAQPWRTALIVALALLSAVADVLTPLYAGRLVDAVASGASSDAQVWGAAVTAFWLLIALGIGSTLLRQGVFQNIIVFTLKMMNGMVSNAFYRVQRFSTDWHANSFAGSTVRKITRGMWAVDVLNDTLLVALLPSVVMLVGATVLLGVYWPVMGLVVGLGSVLYIAVTAALSLGYVAPAARLGNAWDTRMGGALADAVSCNPVVKAFGAETREEARLGRVVDKWRRRTRRTWIRATINGGIQGAMLVAMQAGILGASLLLWSRNQASVGDITFALTMFFMLQGHLRDVGMHIRNLQRSVNDMEELVALEKQPLGVDDRAGAGAIRVTAGEIRFEDVTFRYGRHEAALYDRFSARIAPGERVGLVGHSGSGKTTF